MISMNTLCESSNSRKLIHNEDEKSNILSSKLSNGLKDESFSKTIKPLKFGNNTEEMVTIPNIRKNQKSQSQLQLLDAINLQKSTSCRNSSRKITNEELVEVQKNNDLFQSKFNLFRNLIFCKNFVEPLKIQKYLNEFHKSVLYSITKLISPNEAYIISKMVKIPINKNKS